MTRSTAMVMWRLNPISTTV
ncbi:hypothetical protein M8C21_018251 [Ambrosia artemisiifolia]|uniref:Uncharacterized protein n=1 Tax=Ambrosia artemisiifolia TaxID=4212 RepID=A0AAD5G9I5_AMBAR|nr:hypothetical protein M8C21_018251 [Ambrosia artemisiifolia]